MKLETKDLVYIGVLTAICIVTTMLLMPLPTGGMFHLGSAALFTIGAVYGGLYAGLAGAIGSGIFDIVTGHTSYTIFSIIIKGLAGVTMGILTVGFSPITKQTPGTPLSRIFLAAIAASIVNAVGYFIAWGVVLNSWTVALTRLPATFITSGIGIGVTLLLAPQLQRLAKNILKK